MQEESSQQLGKIGEAIAQKYLQDKHWELIARNWKPVKRKIRGVRGEIDIVARDPLNSQIVFIEVKTLKQPNLDDLKPEDHFTNKKFSKLKTLAQLFLIEHRIKNEHRIDLIAVNMFKGKHNIAHYQGIIL